MRTTSFATLAQCFFGNHVRSSQKGGTTMMKLLREFVALTIVMGMTTSAHADWIRIRPDLNRITGFITERGITTLSVQNNSCAGTGIDFYPIDFPDGVYAVTVLLLNRAAIEGKWMDIYVSCQGTGGRGLTAVLLQ